MISADRFIDLLEEKDLIPSALLAKLRRQVAQAEHSPKAAGVAKALIDKGYLTSALAKRLLASEEETPPDRGRSAEFVSNAAPTLLDDELTPLEVGAGDMAAPAVAPLDNILSSPAMEASESSDQKNLASPKKKSLLGFLKRGEKSTKKKEDWGSVFMLVGGGFLLFFIFAIVLLTWYLYRLGLEEKYQQAIDFYKATSYEQAIKAFEEFAKAFPGRPEASSARVLIGLSEMRQVEQGQDWVECLKTAKTVLDRIKHEDNFNEANGDVAAMLPTIAEGLAKKAKDKSSPELVAQTREALAMIEEYVTKSMQQPTKLANIEASLSLTERQIDRDQELDKAVASLKDAIKQQKTIEAYSIRRALLKKYPDLLDDKTLAATMAEISQAQFAAVKAVPEMKAAVRDEAPSPIAATLSLAQRSTKNALDELQGRVVCVAAEGAAFGIDAASGKLLWRRFIGYPKSAQVIAPPPMPVNAEPGADVLAVDAAQNEVLRLDALTGQLRWRLPVGEQLVPQTVIAENKLFVAASSGKLIAMDLENGDSSIHVQLPQPLRVAPAVDPVKKLIYQVAEHSNLYILGLDDLACKQVYLLGHEMGSVTSAPAVMSGYLVLGVNDGAQDSTLRLFSVERGTAEKPGIAVKQVQQISLKGRIDITPAVDGNRVLVATDRGVAKVFDLTPTEKGTQLREVAESAIEGGENVPRYALLQGGQFWIADIQLSKFDVVGSKGRLVPKWIDYERCAFLQSPVAAGTAVISARRRPNMPGVFVSAVGIEDSSNKYWETIVAAPPAGELVVGEPGKKLLAVTKLGGLFEVDAASFNGQGVLDSPTLFIDPARLQQPIASLTLLEKGAVALSADRGASQVNVFDPADMRYRLLNLNDASACPPINLSGGLLVPTQGGAVFLLDPQNGRASAAPFQAKLDGGVKPVWQKPAQCGKQEFVISDGKTMLYRIGRVDSPKPHLVALDQIEAASDGESPAAVVGNVAFVPGASQTLGLFELPKLKRLNEHKLSGRCVWGPIALGERVLLATDDNQLVCFDDKGEKLWQTPLAYGPMSGNPLLVENGYMFASTNGVLWQVDAKTGKELGKVETGRSLASGPTTMGGQILVVGTDGSIYEVKQP